MLENLKLILEIQEFDIKMIRLMRLKQDRQKELKQIEELKSDLKNQINAKDEEISALKEEISEHESKILEIKEKIKKFEAQQDMVKKMEEFNALNREVSQADRARAAVEQRLNKLAEILMEEEEVLANIQQTFDTTNESSKALEEEIHQSISQINEEGLSLKAKRNKLSEAEDLEFIKIYERLLNNKRNRVVVPITNRCCSGCHIVLTAQQENLVRKAERLIFCEHCSRILYWLETQEPEESKQTTAAKRRRRKAIV